MGVTRGQYIAPPPTPADGSPVLDDQVQGVKVDSESGIKFLPDGTIRFAPEQINVWVETNNITAFNDYVWPTAPPVSGKFNFIVSDGAANLEWWPIGQLNGPGNPVIGTVYSVTFSGGTTGLTFNPGTVTSNQLPVLSGILAVSHGGTGADNPDDARDNLGMGTVREITAGQGLASDPAAGITIRGELYIPDQPNVIPGTYTKATISVNKQGIVTFIKNGTAFPVDTQMLFMQPAAPPGWSQDLTFNDSAIRVVTGAGGTSGAGNPFTTSFAPYTPQGNVTVSGSTSGGTTDNTSITISQMPVHNHGGNINDGGHAHGVNDPGHSHNLLDQGGPQIRDNNNISTAAVFQNRNYPFSVNRTGISLQGRTTGISVQNQGSGIGHSHSIPGVTLNASGPLSGTRTNQFVVRYVDVISCIQEPAP